MPLRTAACALALAALSLLLASGSAHAATVRVITHYPDPEGCKEACGPPSRRLLFRAAPGEANRVTFARTAQGLTIRDAGAAIETKRGCWLSRDSRTATCAAGFATIRLGDGSDTADVDLNAKYAVDRLFGGSGDDRIHLTGAGTVTGGTGDDLLTGDGAEQTLRGGSGRDRLLAGPGDDVLQDGARAPREPVDERDDYRGGPGTDRLDYGDRESPVAIDLAHAGRGAGGRGEKDRFAGIEDVTGGEAADRLAGDDEPNAIDGWLGSDLIRGRGGDDDLDASYGEDRARGGSGNDRISDRGEGFESEGIWIGPNYDGRNDLRCGPGSDSVGSAGAGALVHPDCEYVGYLHPLALDLPLRSLRDPVLRFRPDGCGLDDYDSCHAATIAIREAPIAQSSGEATPHRLLARRRFADRTVPVGGRPLRLSTEGRAELRRLGSVRVWIVTTDCCSQTLFLATLRDPGG